ncbi:MAG: hypothetical protein ACK574_01905 [Bacteroidota bacterium]|jgi:hypothetical protein
MKVNNFNYDKILTHAKYLIKMNKHILGNRLNPDDVVSEVYIKHCETGKEIEKLTRDIVITETRRLTAIKQQNSTKKRFIEKKCKRCNEIKPCNEFYQIYNKDLGFTYYSLYCKACESERKKEYINKVGHNNHNKKRREQYKNNLRAKELAHLRYLKFKNKNKLSLLSKA